MLTTPLVLTLIDADGRQHKVVGWAAEIIGFVVAKAERINAATQGRVECDFGPSGVLSVGFYEQWRVKR